MVWTTRSYPFKSSSPVGLCFLLALTFAPGVLAQVQNVPARISIVVVEGEGVTSNIRQRVTRDPVVRVEDDDHRPVAGAPVVFAVPVAGTSGEFHDGAKTLAVVTDQDGLAVARGLKTNQTPGKLQIYITASFHGRRARALITQIVEAAPGSKAQDLQVHKSGSGKWKWVALGIAAAGGAGAGIYFGRQTSSTPISISTGTVVFGSPR